jgi:hypothetical protein
VPNEALRGVIQGGQVVFLGKDAPLKEGTEVFVTPVTEMPGVPSAVIAAMESAPKVPAEWVDELEELMAEGRRPSTFQDPFNDDHAKNGV